MADSDHISLEWPQWMFGDECLEEEFLELAEAFQLVSAALRGEDSYREHVKMMAALSAAIGGALDSGDKTLDVEI
jgi:hypothetical protein